MGTSKYPKIEKFKNDGNDAFKKGKHDEASSLYFEVFFYLLKNIYYSYQAILEIEELRMKIPLESKELDQLEVSCRLNYANVKSKLDDYKIVLDQAKQVIYLINGI